MKIIQLKSSNIKRLAAVCITPDPANPLVTISGLNGQGKTSVLESILWGIAGGRDVAELPVRKGEERGVIEIDLGDLKVRRVFTAAGGMSLVVTNREGARYPSPQSILDTLMSKVGFDPLEFSRQKPADQYETLRALAGLDFSAIDAARQKAYDERTALSRDIRTLEGQLLGLPEHPDAPKEEVLTVEIMDEWRKASAVNEANQNARQQMLHVRNVEVATRASLENAEENVRSIESEIARLNQKLADAKVYVGVKRSSVETAEAATAAKQAEIDQLVDIDVNPFKDKVQNAETINRQVRHNQQRAKVAASLAEKRQAHTSAEQKIENLDVEKRRVISKATLPIEGLQFEAGRVLFNGIPFAQLSSAEQLRISVAVGLALNPKLKVLLIRDGSLLDENSLRLVAEMAQKESAQVWCERVGDDGECSIIIEDGRVKGAPIPEPTPELPAVTPIAAPAAETPLPTPVMPKQRKKRVEFVPSQSDLIP